MLFIILSEHSRFKSCPQQPSFIIKGKIMKKSEKKKYQVRDEKCYTRECFIPFIGNGIKICRLYEMGQCPEKYKRRKGGYNELRIITRTH